MVVFLEVAAEPGTVVARPAYGANEVLVTVFEAFDEDVASKGKRRCESDDEGKEELFH